MTLEEFRIKHERSYSQLAKHLKIPYQTVYKYCKGERIPRLQIAINIEKRTKGQVKLKDLIHEA